MIAFCQLADMFHVGKIFAYILPAGWLIAVIDWFTIRSLQPMAYTKKRVFTDVSAVLQPAKVACSIEGTVTASKVFGPKRW